MKVYAKSNEFGSVSIVPKDDGTLIEIPDDFDFLKLHQYVLNGEQLQVNEDVIRQEHAMEAEKKKAELLQKLKDGDTAIVDILIGILSATTTDELLAALAYAREANAEALTEREQIKEQLYGIPEWVQPTGAHDAYHVGDKVKYNSTVYICTLADGAGNNVWKPDEYGWEKVGE